MRRNRFAAAVFFAVLVFLVSFGGGPAASPEATQKREAPEFGMRDEGC
jgi:hypothetical protein